MSSVELRGRPRLRNDDEILVAALRAFAVHGFEAMSLRALNTELGLSHGTINQRFGSKEQLYFASIDHGFAEFFADIDRERSMGDAGRSDSNDQDDLEVVRRLIRGFLMAASRRPEFGRLMNAEGLEPSARLDYIVRTVVVPTFEPLAGTLRRLIDRGVIYPVSARTLFFLVAHGAEAPYTLSPLDSATVPMVVTLLEK